MELIVKLMRTRKDSIFKKREVFCVKPFSTYMKQRASKGCS
jgi:hypothetical protein